MIEKHIQEEVDQDDLLQVDDWYQKYKCSKKIKQAELDGNEQCRKDNNEDKYIAKPITISIVEYKIDMDPEQLYSIRKKNNFIYCYCKIVVYC